MLTAMAVTSLLFLSYLVTNSVTPSLQGYTPAQQCSSSSFANVYSNMPSCQPRDTLVKLKLPNDPQIEEVIPSHVLVPRCSGVCHQGNNFHKCVPQSGARATQTFEVLVINIIVHSHVLHTFCIGHIVIVTFATFIMLQVLLRPVPNGSGSSEMKCSSINVEVHNACNCGCDVDVANCNSNQVIQSDNLGIVRQYIYIYIGWYSVDVLSYARLLFFRDMIIFFANVAAQIMKNADVACKTEDRNIGMKILANVCAYLTSGKNAQQATYMMHKKHASK